MDPPVACTVAAHDPLGGAGLAADLATFAALGVHGVAAVTAVSAQHLDSVDRVEPASAEMVAAQLDGIVADLPPVALKTGLLVSADVVELVAVRVAERALPAPVVDPVLVDGRGRRFVADVVERAYRERLFPLARLITPNLAEASLLVGRPLATVDDVVAAGPLLAGLGPEWIVVTGGRLGGDEALDVVISAAGEAEVLVAPRVDTDQVRGSGCTFAAAITARLAHGDGPRDSVSAAKAFVAERLADAAARPLGPGGPVSHRLGS